MTHAYPLGVVIGRFQSPELHTGHHHLITYARERHSELMIIIGSPRGYPTARNPLSFAIRRAMVLQDYPEASVVELHDNPSDAEWSIRVDALISALYPGAKAILYGSRDSFITAVHMKSYPSRRLQVYLVQRFVHKYKMNLCIPLTGDVESFTFMQLDQQSPTPLSMSPS